MNCQISGDFLNWSTVVDDERGRLQITVQDEGIDEIHLFVFKNEDGEISYSLQVEYESTKQIELPKIYPPKTD